MTSIDLDLGSYNAYYLANLLRIVADDLERTSDAEGTNIVVPSFRHVVRFTFAQSEDLPLGIVFQPYPDSGPEAQAA